jgi:hypothetical protein
MLTHIQFIIHIVATNRRLHTLILLAWLMLIIVGVVGAEGSTGGSICPNC